MQNIQTRINSTLGTNYSANSIFAVSAIAITVVLVLIILYVYNPHEEDYEAYMTGSWIADSAFCEEAGLDGAQMFIGPAENRSFLRKLSNMGAKTRKCHILLEPNVTAQLIECNYRPVRAGWRKIGEYVIKPQIQWENEQLWPDSCKWEFDMKSGTLRIYDEDELKMVMYKNYEITNAILGSAESE